VGIANRGQGTGDRVQEWGQGTRDRREGGWARGKASDRGHRGWETGNRGWRQGTADRGEGTRDSRDAGVSKLIRAGVPKLLLVQGFPNVT